MVHGPQLVVRANFDGPLGLMGQSAWVDPRFAAWKTGPMVSPVLRRVIHDLESYYQRPAEQIADAYWQSRHHEENGTPPAASGVEAYYRTVDRYVYESSYFEAFAEYQRYFETVRMACRRFRRRRILDFGGGAGGMTLALSLGGSACDYADIPGPTLDFAKWRLAQYGCSSQVLDATGSLPAATYEAVVTLDVFEHLIDLKQTLKILVRSLVPGGWLISKSTFSPDDPLHLPQNMIYADIRVFNRLLEEFDFLYLGRLRPDAISEQCFNWFGGHRMMQVWIDRKLKFGGRFVVHQLKTPS